VGLLQLLPSTASDLAGEAVSPEQLQQAERNALLGARYLQQLLQRWQGDPLLAIASYNAGPAAVEPWINAQLRESPELWVEAIPYPETRLYVKKVLGNLWSLQAPQASACPPA
jgi:soluble lytic murein transglycosylase